MQFQRHGWHLIFFSASWWIATWYTIPEQNAHPHHNHKGGNSVADPLISVIIPTKDRPHRLALALASVAAQTYAECEVVVVNDGGMEATTQVDRYRAEFRRPARYVDLQPNRGLAGARNTGIAEAAGEWIALLDDDDRFQPDHLARLIAALRAQPTAVLAYDDVLIEIEDGGADDVPPHVIGTCRFGRSYDQAIFDQDDFIAPSSMLFSRAGFQAAGGFDTTIPLCEDWDFLLRLRNHGEFQYVPGAIGVTYSLRVAAGDNLGSEFGATRRRALDLLSERYGLPPLVPKTFLDVARDLGFAITWQKA
jgi:glycosyltransferase involved in cell wall biosynthesis